MMRRIGLIGAGLMAAALAGCMGPRPVTEPGVCYQLTFPKGQVPTYVVVARNLNTIEDCAAKLEGIRLHFLQMGGSIQEIQGAYADQFIFIDVSGVEISKSLNGPRYVLMGRENGQLIRPGYTGARPVDQQPSSLPKLNQ